MKIEYTNKFMISREKKFRKFYLVIIVILVICMFCYWQNNDIAPTKINYHNDAIPKAFDGYTIVQISDLHNKSFGKHQKRLLNQVNKAKPDLILITGDLIDRRHTNIAVAMDFITGVAKIAPIYFVPGNHEASSGKYNELRQQLMKAGVNVLDDTKVTLAKNGDAIEIIGVDDPIFIPIESIANAGYSDAIRIDNKLKSILQDDNASQNEQSDHGKQLNNKKQLFQILLSHRPELVETYAENNIDLVFTGHAHGGQFRIPFLGGLVAPNQGILPKYTSGAYKVKDTTMIVSRGLGNSIIPLRIFNRPEIVVVRLENE